MKITALTCILCSLLLAPANPLAAQSEHEDPVVYADQKSIGEDALRAAGNVEVLWQDYVIYADAIDFNLKSRELFAEGRVTMSSKDMVLSGEKLVFNLKTQKGELLDTYGLVSPVVRYETDRLVQTDRETLTFQKLAFSSCAQIFPRWRITSSKGKIKKDKYIQMSDVLLRIKNVPVFYLPYLRYPLQKDGRSTGLLIPGLGTSEQRGFFMQNSFFWALRPNIDMTFGLDYFARLGVGASDELRYLFRNASGSARFYYFKYRKDNEVYNESDHDSYVEADHTQTLPFLNSRLVLKVNRQSRPDFLRLLDNSFGISRNTNFQTALSLTSTFANMRVSLRVSHEETYNIRTDKPKILDYLPSLAFTLNQQKLGKLPGYFSLGANFSRVRRGGETLDEEALYVNDVFSQRLTLTPSYLLPLFKLPWLNSSLNLTSENTFYAKSRDPESEEISDKPLYLKYHMATFTLQGPTFAKVYDSGKKKLKHVLEPKFEFRYSTKAANRDQLIQVDSFDKPAYSNASFSLTSRLLAKSGGSSSPSELLAYTIAQEYYFDPAEANNDQMIDGKFPTFNELSHSLRLRPGGDLVFDASLEYNYYIRDLTRLNLSVSYSRAAAPLNGSLSYSIVRNPYRSVEFKGNHSNLNCKLNFELRGFPVKLESRVDYDFTDRRLLYGSLNASFDYQCLIFNAEFKIFSWQQESYPQFRFGISLGNLGMVDDFFGGK